MKNEIKMLKRDLKIDNNFVERLKKAGMEVEYGKFSYWDNQEYVQIGSHKLWLVCEWCENNSSGVRFKTRNTFISQLYETIEEQKDVISRLDKKERDFWAKLEG